MLLYLFSESVQSSIIIFMIMPSILSSIVGILGALTTEMTEKIWLKIVYGAIPAVLYLAFCPTDVIFLVLFMYFLALVYSLLRWHKIVA